MARGQGFQGRNLEGGLGGPPPPNVDGGLHFRRKCDFAMKNLLFSPQNLRLRKAMFRAIVFTFIVVDADRSYY